MPQHHRSQLVRSYVGKRLADYYAQPADRVVGHSSGVKQSNLSGLLGEWHWRRKFKKLYDEREGHWLTPVELFQPYYSHILANYCLESYSFMTTQQQQNDDDSNASFEIVELGGGRGTNAELILSYLQEKKPDLYERLSYTIVDSSPSLHKLQRDLLDGGDHASRVRYVLKDLLHVAEEKVELFPKSDTPTVVIGCEVLDNLPHDKVRARTRKKIQQAEVRDIDNDATTTTTTTTTTTKEEFVPLSDPLLSKVLRRVPAYVANNYPTWIPTVACGIMQHITKQRPNLSFAFADFDWLPAPDIVIDDDVAERISEWAEGEPIVTDMKGVDHECYLVAPPHCDILFPTDFEKLAAFARATNVVGDKAVLEAEVHKQSEFLERYGPEHVRATKSWLTGHTPLLHDFTNCSVLTGRIRASGVATGGAANTPNNKKRRRRGPPRSTKPPTNTCVMLYSTMTTR